MTQNMSPKTFDAKNTMFVLPGAEQSLKLQNPNQAVLDVSPDLQS
jgi:hypothetical protein